MYKNKNYLSILNHLSEGVYFVDTDKKILFWNKAAEKITGYTSNEIVGKDYQDTPLSHIDENGQALCSSMCPLFSTLLDGEQRKATVYVRHKKGFCASIHTNIFPFYEGDRISGAVEIFTQKSQNVYSDSFVSSLSHTATHDPLTTLPNRQYTKSYLEYKLNNYKQFGKQFAVLYADIDFFRYFNNKYGHLAGDEILKNISKIMMECVGKDNLIGRVGGEEFFGVYDVSSQEALPIIGEQLRQNVENTVNIYDGKKLKVTISIGVTLVKEDDTFDSIIKRADKLMYSSKRNGRNKVTIG